MKTLFSSALFGTVALSGMAQASLPQNPLPVAVYTLPGSDFSALRYGHVASVVTMASSHANLTAAPDRN